MGVVAGLAVAAGLVLFAPDTSTRPLSPAAARADEVAWLPPTSAAATTTTTAPPLVLWAGPVEHLFFHTLVIRPEVTFRSREGPGFRQYFVTVREFRSILSQLDANGWTMVDIHRVINGRVRVPPGRRPFVLSEDDVNYYDYSRQAGLGWRLVLDPHGDVKVEIHDDSGVRVTDEDLVPIVDQFVADHPEFSADGAKGLLGVTGYEGLLGERVNDTASPDWAASVARATAVANRLKATGWQFANHSFGHIDFAKRPFGWVVYDIQQWRAEAEPIIGTTDVFIYPFGSAPPIASRTVSMLRDNGFTVLCDIDVAPRLVRANGVTVMSRRHIDGLALDQQASRLSPFFDAARTRDPARNL